MIRHILAALAMLVLTDDRAFAQVAPPRIPATLKQGKQHQLKAPTGPLAYRDETYRGSLWIVNRYPSLPANDLTAERARLTCSDSCILLTRPSKGAVLRDLDLTGTGDKAYKAGIKLDSTVSGVLIERVAVRGFKSTLPKGYPNADGLAFERGNSDIVLRHVSATDNTDGCIDTKAVRVRLEHVYLARCRYPLRQWGELSATDLTLDSGGNANLYIKPGSVTHVDRLTLAGPVPKHGDVYQDGAGASMLSIGWCSRPLVLSASVRKWAALTLGEGCK